MKDPLRTEQTPYEILGVGREAGRAEIDKALIATLRKRVPANIAKNARDDLLSVMNRAWYDLFEYDERVLARLKPSPLKNPPALHRVNRADTARSWKEQLKAKFPDLVTIHSLAVLWYWWTKYEEERLVAMVEKVRQQGKLPGGILNKKILLQSIRKTEGVSCKHRKGKKCPNKRKCPWKKDCRSSAPQMMKMWEQVISYWVTLAVTTFFWDKTFDLSNKDAKVIIEKLFKSLQDTLFDMANRYDDLNAHENADQYRTLTFSLSTEIQSAKLLKKAGIAIRSGKTYCGTLMLTRMDLIDDTRSKVDKLLKEQPENQTFQKLKNMLSPFASIAILIDQNKPEAALEAIKQLPTNEQETEEVKGFRARGYHMLAKQKASLEQMDLALEAWSSALSYERGLALEAAFSALSPEAALEALECPNRVDSEIKNELVEICHKKAVAMQRKNLNGAIAILDKANSLVLDEKIRLTLVELLTQRGLEVLNTTYKKACSEKRGSAPETIKAFESALADLERAEELGSRDGAEHAEVARNVLWQAKSGFLNLPDEVMKLYAKVNQAAGREDWDEAIKFLKEAISITGNETPKKLKIELGICLANRGQSTIAQGIQLINEGDIQAEPDPEGISLMQAGERDLEEAAQFDPDSEHIKKHLCQVRNDLAQLQVRARVNEIDDLVAQAHQAAEKKDWDEAIKCFKEVIEIMGDSAPQNFRQNLAVCLKNRGTEKINLGKQKVYEEARDQNTSALTLLASYYNDFPECTICGKFNSENYAESWFSIPLSSGKTAPLCQSCTDLFKERIENPPDPCWEGSTLISSGKSDLREAKEYESPSSLPFSLERVSDAFDRWDTLSPFNPFHQENNARNESLLEISDRLRVQQGRHVLCPRTVSRNASGKLPQSKEEQLTNELSNIIGKGFDIIGKIFKACVYLFFTFWIFCFSISLIVVYNYKIIVLTVAILYITPLLLDYFNILSYIEKKDNWYSLFLFGELWSFGFWRKWWKKESKFKKSIYIAFCMAFIVILSKELLIQNSMKANTLGKNSENTIESQTVSENDSSQTIKTDLPEEKLKQFALTDDVDQKSVLLEEIHQLTSEQKIIEILKNMKTEADKSKQYDTVLKLMLDHYKQNPSKELLALVSEAHLGAAETASTTQEKIQLLKTVIEINPNSPKAKEKLVSAFLNEIENTTEFKVKEHWLKKTVEILPDDEQVKKAAASAYMEHVTKIENIEERLELLRKTIELNPSADTYYLMALTQGKKGDYTAKIQTLRKALEYDPNREHSREALAGTYFNIARKTNIPDEKITLYTMALVTCHSSCDADIMVTFLH